MRNNNNNNTNSARVIRRADFPVLGAGQGTVVRDMKHSAPSPGSGHKPHPGISYVSQVLKPRGVPPHAKRVGGGRTRNASQLCLTWFSFPHFPAALNVIDRGTLFFFFHTFWYCNLQLRLRCRQRLKSRGENPGKFRQAGRLFFRSGCTKIKPRGGKTGIGANRPQVTRKPTAAS